MSSFQYSDNFSGFNDLINRVEFLEEKTWKDTVKGAGINLADWESEGKKISATSRVKNLIIIRALIDLDLINDEVAKALKRKATSSTYITNTLKELAPKAYDELFDDDKPGSVEVVEYVKGNLDHLVSFAVKNATRKEFEKKEIEELENVDPKEVESEVSAEVEIAQSLQVSKEDPTTLIEIRISDAGRASDVGRMFATHANEEGIDIDGDMIQFSVDPGSPITQLIAKKGVGAIEAAIKASADKISDSRVVIMLPDENFEQSLYGDEEGDSYEGNISSVQTAEEDEVDDLIMNNDKEAFILTVTDNVKRALKKALNRKGILFNDVEEGLTVAPEDHSIALRVKDKISSSYAEEEEFRESYTDGYMSDQSSSDKRNKKKEVLSESFKDRYKPKTHWQLEELRRYGL